MTAHYLHYLYKERSPKDDNLSKKLVIVKLFKFFLHIYLKASKEAMVFGGFFLSNSELRIDFKTFLLDSVEMLKVIVHASL